MAKNKHIEYQDDRNAYDISLDHFTKVTYYQYSDCVWIDVVIPIGKIGIEKTAVTK